MVVPVVPGATTVADLLERFSAAHPRFRIHPAGSPIISNMALATSGGSVLQHSAFLVERGAAPPAFPLALQVLDFGTLSTLPRDPFACGLHLLASNKTVTVKDVDVNVRVRGLFRHWDARADAECLCCRFRTFWRAWR